MVTGPEARLTFGSLPKQFTGYLVHRLADRALLQLDQPIEQLLPELRGSPAGTPTVRQLLQMTSGLPGSIDFLTNVRLQLGDDWMSDADLLRTIRGYGLAFSPGSAFLYSNVGYRLLAVVATRVTKRDWPTLLREEVLEPVGMNGAGVFEPGQAMPKDCCRDIFRTAAGCSVVPPA